MSKTKPRRAACILILLSILNVGLNTQRAKSESTKAIETTIFTDSYYVASKTYNFSSIPLNGGTNVRIVFNASKPIDFFCQDSWNYTMSNSTKWTTVYSLWSEKTSLMNRTFIIPTTDRWYFTFVNYENGTSVPPIDIYSIALYRIDTYDIHVESDKQSYNLGEQALLTARIRNDSNPILGMNVSLQVFDPQGNPINSQNGLTDVYGQVTIAVILPSEEGMYDFVAKTSVAGNPFEDATTFVVAKNSTLPSTFENYDGLWHTQDFAITLLAFDGESGVAETYYRINDGPTQNVSISGQPQITTEGINNTLEYWSKDNAGHEEFPHKILTGIKLDESLPSGSILINENATYANSVNVTLTLSATDVVSGVAQMRFSNDNLTWSDWEIFNSSRSWTLVSGDGSKTVYTQFKDNARLISDTYSATVTLETTAPVIQNVSRMPENVVQPAEGTTILANVTDPGSGVKSVVLSYSMNINNTWFDTQMVLNSTTGLYEGIVPGQLANTQVEYRILSYDNAGNEKIGDNQGQYYAYTVVPEFPLLEAAFLFITMTLLAVAFREKHRAREN